MTSAHFTGLAGVIAAEVAQARTRIDVAVAWFTDPSLCQALVRQAQANVQVTVVIRGDNINFTPLGPGKLDWQSFLVAGGVLYAAPAQTPLHHKFCVVDQQRVLSGSYNWTRAARQNQENILLCDEPTVADAFGREFQTLLTQSMRITDVPAMIAAVPPALDTVAQEDALVSGGEASSAAGTSYGYLLTLAEAAFFQKEYDEAQHLLTQAISQDPRRDEAYDVLAGVYWQTGQFAPCVAVIQQAEAHGLGNPALWNMAGLGHHGLNDFKQAVHCFDRSIAAEPTNSVFYLNKCTSLDAWGRKLSGNKVASEGRQVASAQIERYQDGSNDAQLLHGYLTRAYLRDRPEDRRFDARAAKAIFDRMPSATQNLHDLEQINYLLK